MKEQDGHGYWSPEKFGPPKEVISDSKGVAKIRFPSRLQVGHDWLTTSQITFRVTYPDFVQQVVYFNLGPEQSEVTLEPGCEVQVSAVDQQGAAIKDFAILMSGPFASTQWVTDGQGMRRTRAIKEGHWQTMLVSIPESGPALFGGVLPFTARSGQAVRMRNLRLAPGTHLKGTLSANVPRPVKNGRVIVQAIPKPAGNSYAAENPSLVWHECAAVDEAGNFEFLSLPRGGEIQIIVICDSWLSKTTIPDGRNVFVMGQLFSLDDLKGVITVEMEPSGELEVTVKKPDGSPLEGATLWSSPNQCYYKGGSTILGQEFNSRDGVLWQLKPVDKRKSEIGKITNSNFAQKTNAQGKAMLKGLPLHASEYIRVEHPGFQLPLEEENRDRIRRYTLTSNKTELEVVVEPVKKDAAAGQ